MERVVFEEEVRMSKQCTFTRVAVGACGFWLAIVGDLSAQNLTVQQPVFGVTSAATTVSVPDRGRAYIGGVSRGATSRNSYGGPFRSGTNSGSEFSHQSMTASVFIHDFDELDRQALAIAGDAGSRDSVRLSPHAANAYNALTQRRTGAGASAGAVSTPAPLPGTAVPTTTADRSSEIPRWLASAKKARSDGKEQLALIYFRLAAKAGSPEAEQILATTSPTDRRHLAHSK